MHKFTDLNSVLDAMPRFLEHENSLKPGDPRATPIRSAADPTQPLVFFEKNGRLGYRSSCPHYSGYWVDGFRGGVACNQIDFLLPGIILELYCRFHCEDCPLNDKSNEKEMAE